MIRIRHENLSEMSTAAQAWVSYITVWVCVAITLATIGDTAYRLWIKPTKTTEDTRIDNKQPTPAAAPGTSTEIRISKYLKWMHITCMTSLSSNFLFCLTTGVIFSRNLFSREPFSCYIIGLNAPFIAIARFSLYLFLLARFAWIFEGTELNLSRATYVVMIASMFATCFGSIVVYFVWLMVFNCANEGVDYAALPAAVQDLFWSLVLMYLFVSKMSHLRSNCPNSKHTVKMLRFCIRLFILTVSTSLTTVLQTCSTAFLNVGMTVCVDACMNGFFMILSFSAYNKTYHRLCGRLTNCCFDCVRKRRKHEINVRQESIQTSPASPASPASRANTINRTNAKNNTNVVNSATSGNTAITANSSREQPVPQFDFQAPSQAPTKQNAVGSERSERSDHTLVHTRHGVSHASRRASFNSTKLGVIELKNLPDHFFIEVPAHVGTSTDNLNDLEIRPRGKRNQPAVRKIDINSFERDLIVEDEPMSLRLNASVTESDPDITRFDSAYEKNRNSAVSDVELDLSETLDGAPRPEKPVITLIFYELRHVVATNCSTFDVHVQDFGQSPKRLKRITEEAFLLAFGGKQRLRHLTNHFRKLVENKDVTLFIVSNDYNGELMFDIMKSVQLSTYFRTRVEKGKCVGHVVGKDNFVRKSVNREYLSILQVLHVMQCRNENVLYVGHDANIVQDLNTMNVCHTYRVKTKGMTKYDMLGIETNYCVGKPDYPEPVHSVDQ